VLLLRAGGVSANENDEPAIDSVSGASSRFE
jgi:hypothetical protein